MSSSPHALLSLSTLHTLLSQLLSNPSSTTLITTKLPSISHEITKEPLKILEMLVYEAREEILRETGMHRHLGAVTASKHSILVQDTDLHTKHLFLSKLKHHISRYREDVLVEYLWMYLDVHWRGKELDWRRWHAAMLHERLQRHILRIVFGDMKEAMLNASMEGLQIGNGEEGGTYVPSQFAAIASWQPDIISPLFDSILETNLQRRVAHTLREKFVHWASECRGQLSSYHPTKLPAHAQKNEICLLTHFLEQNWDFLVQVHAHAPISETQSLSGFLISHGRATESMPQGLQGNMGLIVIQDAHEESAGHSEDDSPQGFTIKVKTREMLLEMQQQKLAKIESFIQLLLKHQVRVVLVQKHTFDPQCLMSMAQHNIVCIHTLSSREVQHVTHHFGIEPVQMFGLQFRHPFVFHPPQDLNPETNVAWVSSFRQYKFAPGDVVSHLIPLKEEKRCSTLLLRAPMAQIGQEYARILKKCLVNIRYDAGFSALVEEVLSGESEPPFNSHTNYIIPGGGYLERIASRELMLLSQPFTAPQDGEWKDVHLSPVHHAFMSALSGSFDRLSKMVPLYKDSVCSLSRQMRVMHLVLNEV